MTSKEVGKLEEVLQLFLLPNYNIASATYLDLLLTQIADVKTGVEQNHHKLLQSWVPKALNTWSSGHKPCQPLCSFTIKVVGLIAQKEEVFKFWKREDVYNKLCGVFHLRENHLPASIKMAYTSMLCNLIQHPSGRQWVKESGLWIDMVRYAQINHTLYVTRESQKFVWSLLLYELEDKKYCETIISAVVAPLIQDSYSKQAHSALEENYLDDNALLITTFDLLTSILENTLFLSLDNTIPRMIEDLSNLETRIRALYETCISTRFAQHMHKLLLLTLFKRLKDGIKGPDTEVDPEVSGQFRLGLCFISSLLLTKKLILDITRVNKWSLVYWKKLNSVCRFSLGIPHKFEHQVTCLMLMPLSSTFGGRNKNNDFFETFVEKLFDITCATVQRLSYNIRYVILKTDLPMEQICKSTVEMILEITDIMDRDVAIITFQTMCHVLKCFIPIETQYSEEFIRSPQEQGETSTKSLLDGDPMIEKPILLSALLDGLTVMIEKFKLKWQECVETIGVMTIGRTILERVGILPMNCVKALKLCNMAIQNFMPPNLALLLDSEIHVNEIGPMLSKNIYNPNWEVVDSVLEVLNTMAVISEEKYPPFREFILNRGFLEVATTIFMGEGESYVRASALIFISSTVRLRKIYRLVLSGLDLLSKALHLISRESEAIVRKEAVALLNQLYIHGHCNKSMIEVVVSTMGNAAVMDLHWEVKVNALKFWESFIQSHFTDQGMLDGVFPPETFCKETKRIVKLNDTEIGRRINRALDKLSYQSCFGVLLQAYRDESDFQVCKTAADIMKRLKTFLIKFGVILLLPDYMPPEDSAKINEMHVRPPNVSDRKLEEPVADFLDVINEIVNTNDVSLLSEICTSSMKMDDDKQEREKEAFKRISKITRLEFVSFLLQTDIDAYINKKSSWLTNYTSCFDSALDDILMLHQQKDINSMDCY